MSLQCGSAGTSPISSSRFDHELIRRVRTAVRTDPADVEDACSFARIQFFRYQPDREREHLRAVVLINAAVGRHARAARLRELQDHTPEWLANTIGRVPPLGRNTSRCILAWRRAAPAIDDYRRVSGWTSPADGVGPTPIDPPAGRAHQRAERTIAQLHEERQRRHGRARDR
jgi:hypothetical protein